MTPELRSHLIPFLVVAVVGSLAAAGWLLADAAPPGWWSDVARYLALGAVLFACSSLYHLAVGTPLEEALNEVDHLGIHLMIAGAGTLHMQVLPAIVAERVPWLVGALLALAAIGVAYRVRRGDRASGPLVLVLYGLMAATMPAALDWDSPELLAPAMLVTYASMVVYGASVILFFLPSRKVEGKEHLHTAWHLGVVTGYVLGGAALLL